MGRGAEDGLRADPAWRPASDVLLAGPQLGAEGVLLQPEDNWAGADGMCLCSVCERRKEP